MAWSKSKGKPAAKKGTGTKGKSKYTSAQQKAYQAGRGYKLGKMGKRIEFKNPETEESFFAGYKSVDSTKYPNAEKR